MQAEIVDSVDPGHNAVINSDTLNIRTGAGVGFPKVDDLVKGQEVFIVEQKGGWSKISMEEKWVSNMLRPFFQQQNYIN